MENSKYIIGDIITVKVPRFSLEENMKKKTGMIVRAFYNTVIKEWFYQIASYPNFWFSEADIVTIDTL